MKIKICGIKSIEEARHCMAAGADLIGINLIASSKRFWPDGPLAIAKHWPKSQKSFVWVVADMAADDVVNLCSNPEHVMAVQFHGREDVSFLHLIRTKIPNSVEIWKAVGVTDQASVVAAHAFAQATDLVLFDKGKSDGQADGGSGKTFDWSLLNHRPSSLKSFGIAGGITPENVSDCRPFQPHLVDTASGVEGADGRKSIERVKALVAAATC
jgi:phosphoribosylanthranilate isomerase